MIGILFDISVNVPREVKLLGISKSAVARNDKEHHRRLDSSCKWHYPRRISLTSTRVDRCTILSCRLWRFWKKSRPRSLKTIQPNLERTSGNSCFCHSLYTLSNNETRIKRWAYLLVFEFIRIWWEKLHGRKSLKKIRVYEHIVKKLDSNFNHRMNAVIYDMVNYYDSSYHDEDAAKNGLDECHRVDNGSCPWNDNSSTPTSHKHVFFHKLHWSVYHQMEKK